MFLEILSLLLSMVALVMAIKTDRVLEKIKTKVDKLENQKILWEIESLSDESLETLKKIYTYDSSTIVPLEILDAVEESYLQELQEKDLIKISNEEIQKIPLVEKILKDLGKIP